LPHTCSQDLSRDLRFVKIRKYADSDLLSRLTTVGIYLPHVEENERRGVDVQSCSTVIKELDAAVEYCLDRKQDKVRSFNVKGCIPDRETMTFPIAPFGIYLPLKYQDRIRLMKRLVRNYGMI